MTLKSMWCQLHVLNFYLCMGSQRRIRGGLTFPNWQCVQVLCTYIESGFYTSWVFFIYFKHFNLQYLCTCIESKFYTSWIFFLFQTFQSPVFVYLDRIQVIYKLGFFFKFYFKRFSLEYLCTYIESRLYTTWVFYFKHFSLQFLSQWRTIPHIPL